MSKKALSRNKKQQIPYKLILFSIVALIFIGFTIHYRHAISFLINKSTYKTEQQNIKLTRYDLRNIELMDRYYLDTFGLDISHYQGEINWTEMKTIYDIYPINYVFIRATMGSFSTDKRFNKNWKESRENGFIRGAYHFYRPDENSTVQAENFIRNVDLKKGDLPPVLDIETMPKNQPMVRLVEGLKNWCSIIESHYGIKPIIYTSDKYHQDFLIEHFDDYIIWIANYNFFVENMQPHWDFWQFTEKAQIKGTREKVDVNIYRGTIDQLKNITL